MSANYYISDDDLPAAIGLLGDDRLHAAQGQRG